MAEGQHTSRDPERLSDGRLDPDALAALPDDELISLLRKAVRATYRLDHLPTEEEVLVIAEKWRPYRSLATAYLFSAASDEARGGRRPCGA
jgi:3-methyladenine DNA glycosylase/8-oxoguanine DNA glycosylase